MIIADPKPRNFGKDQECQAAESLIGLPPIRYFMFRLYTSRNHRCIRVLLNAKRLISSCSDLPTIAVPSRPAYLVHDTSLSLGGESSPDLLFFGGPRDPANWKAYSLQRISAQDSRKTCDTLRIVSQLYYRI